MKDFKCFWNFCDMLETSFTNFVNIKSSPSRKNSILNRQFQTTGSKFFSMQAFLMGSPNSSDHWLDFFSSKSWLRIYTYLFCFQPGTSDNACFGNIQDACRNLRLKLSKYPDNTFAVTKSGDDHARSGSRKLKVFFRNSLQSETFSSWDVDSSGIIQKTS